MTETTADVRALVESVAKMLVDVPSEVTVEQVLEHDQDGDVSVIELTVAEPDMGRVIGRNGRTARALRALVDAAGVRANKHFELEILE